MTYVSAGEESAERQGGVHIISLIAIVISTLYSVGYALLGFYQVALYSMAMVLSYGIIFGLNRSIKVSTRLTGISLIIIGLIHIEGLCLLFIPAAVGTHLFLLVIPLFSLILIAPRDWMFSSVFSLIALTSIVYLDWGRELFEPIYHIDFPKEILPAWRAISTGIVILFIMSVFWVFYHNLLKARQELKQSLERSDRLLLNILPRSIADRLKEGTSTIADDIQSASVLFTDLVGFTTLASTQTASETVEMLHEIFSAFDQATTARGLEKIKTIGDAYMVASGVPTERGDHEAQLIYLGMDMLQILELYNKKSGLNLKLRIGINSGPVTAGVIGTHKFSYDLWGDTVNVASRMESSGIPNRIQVTKSVAEATGDLFTYEARETLTIKGKGTMEAFLLQDVITSSPHRFDGSLQFEP